VSASRAALLRREGTLPDGRAYLIRPTRDADAPALVALHDSVAAEGRLIAAAPGDRTVLEESLGLAGLLSQGGLSLTLEVEAATAGQVMVRRLHQRLEGDEGEVAIAVHNWARGVGLGRLLMEVAIEWARAVRLARLTLAVFPDNEPALRLYRFLGFVEDPTLRGRLAHHAGAHDLLLMSLSL
jgi:putative acetyltransferase